MLVDPRKVNKIWDELIEIIEDIYAVEVEMIEGDVVHNIYMNIMAGIIKVYVITAGDKPLVFILSSITQNPGGLKTFYIQGIYSFENVNAALWYKVISLLRQEARKFDCKFVSGKSANKRLIELAKKFGGNVDYRFITLEV